MKNDNANDRGQNWDEAGTLEKSRLRHSRGHRKPSRNKKNKLKKPV